MTNEEMMLEMLQSQDKLNRKLNPKWKTQYWNHGAALLVESGEVLDELKYKWWKAPGRIDCSAVRLELVDMWHFALNIIELHPIVRTNVLNDLASNIEEADLLVKYRLTDAECIACVSKTVGDFLYGRCELVNFLAVCSHYDMPFAELYKQYTIKNVLNEFRWDHGYLEGTYGNAVYYYEGRQYIVKSDSALAAKMGEELKEFTREGLYASLALAYTTA